MVDVNPGCNLTKKKKRKDKLIVRQEKPSHSMTDYSWMI